MRNKIAYLSSSGDFGKKLEEIFTLAKTLERDRTMDELSESFFETKMLENWSHFGLMGLLIL